MNVLEAKNLVKRFPGVVALNKVDLNVRNNEIQFIVGENGAGKSTLVKSLMGLYDVDEGEIILDGQDVRSMHNKREYISKLVSYVPQEIYLFMNLTLIENLFMPFNKSGINYFSKNLFLKEAKFYIEKLKMRASPFDLAKDMSVADQQMLQIARALKNENFKILILDEPTASITKAEVDRLFNILRSLREEGKSIVIISHKLNEVFELGDYVTVLRNGQLVGSEEVKETSINQIIKQMTGKTIDQLQEYRPRKPLGEKVLEVDNLNGVNFKNISFDLKAGEILGLAGLVGSGRTEITKTIFGTLKKKSGSVRLFGNELKKLQPDNSVNKGLVYLPEERKSEGIFPNLDVKENSTIIVLNKLVKLGLISFKQENKITKNMIKNFNVKVDKLSTKILNLSGGNQQKVLIGRVMESKPRIIIFDEPTRGIDVGSKEEIYKIMQYLAEELRTGIIFISSELEELIRCCNRIISMYNGEKMLESSGDEIKTENILSAILGINNNQHQEVTSK